MSHPKLAIRILAGWDKLSHPGAALLEIKEKQLEIFPQSAGNSKKVGRPAKTELCRKLRLNLNQAPRGGRPKGTARIIADETGLSDDTVLPGLPNLPSRGARRLWS